MATRERRDTVAGSLARWRFTAAKVGVIARNPVAAASRKLTIKQCPPATHPAREPRRHLASLTESPSEFAAEHLVEQPYEPFRLETDGGSYFRPTRCCRPGCPGSTMLTSIH